MEPVINLEEKVGKTVGQRRAPNPLRTQPDEVENAKHWQQTFGGMRVRPGVYRFTSFEAADEWTRKHQILSRR